MDHCGAIRLFLLVFVAFSVAFDCLWTNLMSLGGFVNEKEVFSVVSLINRYKAGSFVVIDISFDFLLLFLISLCLSCFQYQLWNRLFLCIVPTPFYIPF